MNAQRWTGVQYLLTTQSPLLPPAWMESVWMTLAWGVVTAWLGVCALGWISQRRYLQWGTVLVLLAWSWLPASYSSTHWLGLAFQSPSVTMVALCAAGLWRRMRPHSQAPTASPAPSLWMWGFSGLGIAVGWLLLLDTLALLPLSLFPWGWTPLAVALAALVALLPWAIQVQKGAWDIAPWVFGSAVVVFLLTRLPGGNLWDALLDPWLWLAMHGFVAVQIYRHLQRRGAA